MEMIYDILESTGTQKAKTTHIHFVVGPPCLTLTPDSKYVWNSHSASCK